MSVNLHTLNDIRKHFIDELKGIYPENEIIAITNLIFKTQFGINRLHLLLDSNQIVSSQNAKRIIAIYNELK